MCSLCLYNSDYPTPLVLFPERHCNKCELSDNPETKICAKEFIQAIKSKTYEDFMLAAFKLYDRIKKMKYKNYIKLVDEYNKSLDNESNIHSEWTDL